MAKKTKFPLKLKDDAEVRTLDELHEHFDLEKIIGYFQDGRLLTWLNDRDYENEAKQVEALDKADGGGEDHQQPRHQRGAVPLQRGHPVRGHGSGGYAADGELTEEQPYAGARSRAVLFGVLSSGKAGALHAGMRCGPNGLRGTGRDKGRYAYSLYSGQSFQP